MKRFIGSAGLIIALMISAFGASNVSAQKSAPTVKPAPDAAAQGKPIPGQYIVVLKEGVSAKGLLSTMNIKAKHSYGAVLNGFAATLNDSQLHALRNNPNIASIEQDQEVTLATTQTGATWGIDRIDQRNLPLSGSYYYVATASTVHAYIIDTGLQSNHPEFGTRAANVYNSTGDGNPADCNGHGTHVGGTVGGATYGVAKSVRLYGVKVLGCNGSGTWSGIIAGMDWVRLNARKPAVANMSLGGGYSSSVNTAATNLANSGVFVAVAAGNSNANACNYSPASASGVLTVAASTSSDAKSSFSNYGSCVDVYAPGSSITSAWISSGTNTINGTSMASPHAAGVAALYKATYGDAASSTIVSWIINNSTGSVISGNPTGTPNRLLYKGGL